MARRAGMPSLKGAALGALVPLTLLCLVRFAWDLPWAESCRIAAIVGGLSVAMGTVSGTLAGRIREKRFLRLSLCAVGLELCASLVLAFLMTFAEDSFPADYSFTDQWTGALKLGLTGFLIFAPFFIPLVIGATFVLERWTRGDVAGSAPESAD